MGCDHRQNTMYIRHPLYLCTPPPYLHVYPLPTCMCTPSLYLCTPSLLACVPPLLVYPPPPYLCTPSLLACVPPPSTCVPPPYLHVYPLYLCTPPPPPHLLGAPPKYNVHMTLTINSRHALKGNKTRDQRSSEVGGIR